VSLKAEKEETSDPLPSGFTGTVQLPSRDPAASKLYFSPRLRSPVGVYAYLGEVMNRENADLTGPAFLSYATLQAKNRFGSTFLDIVQGGPAAACGVAIEYGGRSYCVKDGDRSTSNLLALLQDLRNLSITPADLNAPFSVRVE
jgi:hypothetical protein